MNILQIQFLRKCIAELRGQKASINSRITEINTVRQELLDEKTQLVLDREEITIQIETLLENLEAMK